jgi:hypothetical protein
MHQIACGLAAKIFFPIERSPHFRQTTVSTHRVFGTEVAIRDPTKITFARHVGIIQDSEVATYFWLPVSFSVLLTTRKKWGSFKTVCQFLVVDGCSLDRFQSLKMLAQR